MHPGAQPLPASVTQYVPAAQIASPHVVSPLPLFAVTDEHAAPASDSLELQAGSENVVTIANALVATATAENPAIVIPAATKRRGTTLSTPNALHRSRET